MEAIRDHLVIDLVDERLILEAYDFLLVLLDILVLRALLPLSFQQLVNAVLLLDADNLDLPALLGAHRIPVQQQLLIRIALRV